MIHDAKVEVTCDGKGCGGAVYVDLHAGAQHTYLAKDSDIEKALERDHGWFSAGGNVHYCSMECRANSVSQETLDALNIDLNGTIGDVGIKVR